MKSIDIKAVAKAANVSISTVSRVVNHPEKVSEEKRNRILRVMKEMDYQPNWFAQNIHRERTNVIGLIIQDFSAPANMEIAQGIEDVAHDKGFGIMLCNGSYSEEREKEHIELLINRKVSGIIVVSPQSDGKSIERIRSRGVGCVLIGGQQNFVHENQVSIDHRSIAKKAALHFIGLEKRNIGILLAENSGQEEKEKLKGYQDALEDANIPFSEKKVLWVENSIAGGYIGVGKLLDEKELLDGIFATSDKIGFGAIEKIKQESLKIPEDIGIIGCDDFGTAIAVEPKLTTISNPMYRMGLMASRILFDQIEGEEEISKVVLQSKLRIRKSCGNKERINEIL